jgi:transcription antitermination factor NusB
VSRVRDETANQRPGTTHPRLARERALKVLFAADVRRVDPRRLLDEVETHEPDLELLDELEPDQQQVERDEDLQLELTRRRRLPLDDYTRLLVDGVASRQRQIDELLGSVADNWQVRRMPSVDRNLLRLGIYELAEQDTPHAVVIDEAVSLAVAFAGDKAQSFVNGVLEAVRKKVVAGEVDLTPPPPPPPSTPGSSTATSGDEVEAPDVEPTDGPAVGSAQGEAVAAAEEHVTEPDVASADLSADLAEVDTAAQEAYDLALDLLEADGPLTGFDDGDNPDDLDDERFEDVALDEVDEHELAGADLDTSDLRDEDDALW